MNRIKKYDEFDTTINITKEFVVCDYYIKIDEFKKNIIDRDKSGGVITLSTDVNVFNSNSIKDKITSWISGKYNTLMNRFNKNKKISDLLKSIDSMRENGYTVGKMGIGSYISKDGRLFDEKSFNVTINGLNTENLDLIANELSKTFNQEAVLVHNYNDNSVYLLYPDND